MLSQLEFCLLEGRSIDRVRDEMALMGERAELGRSQAEDNFRHRQAL